MPFRVKLSPARPRPPTLEELFAWTPRVPVAPPDPRAGLWRLLDHLEALRAARAKVERHELADKILDLFASYPGEAGSWFRAWRTAHPEARLQ